MGKLTGMVLFGVVLGSRKVVPALPTHPYPDSLVIEESYLFTHTHSHPLIPTNDLRPISTDSIHAGITFRWFDFRKTAIGI